MAIPVRKCSGEVYPRLGGGDKPHPYNSVRYRQSRFPAHERTGHSMDHVRDVARVCPADTHCIYVPPLAHDDDLLM